MIEELADLCHALRREAASRTVSREALPIFVTERCSTHHGLSGKAVVFFGLSAKKVVNTVPTLVERKDGTGACTGVRTAGTTGLHPLEQFISSCATGKRGSRAAETCFDLFSQYRVHPLQCGAQHLRT